MARSEGPCASSPTSTFTPTFRGRRAKISNLCVVGDPDQSIYGFRGADPSYFERFTADYPGAPIVVLTENYRSTANIVGAATKVIERSPGRAARPLRPQSAAATPIERFCAADE